MSVQIRPVRLKDVPVLAGLLRINREFLSPWEPVRTDDYFTDEGQDASVRTMLELHEQGRMLPCVIVDTSGTSDADGRIIGRINLNEIVRGAFDSCRLAYWVSAAENGRGVATAAVGDIVRVAFEELGLHRIEAGTLLHNTASRRVLERNGFVRYGTAPTYLRIAGVWQDHAMYQLVATSAGNNTEHAAEDTRT